MKPPSLAVARRWQICLILRGRLVAGIHTDSRPGTFSQTAAYMDSRRRPFYFVPMLLVNCADGVAADAGLRA